jgi:hypothetical protein
MQIAPTTAAGFMGTNQAQQQQMEQAKQLELAQLMQQRQAQEDRAQALAPGGLQYQQLQNQELQARIPGVQAQSETQALDLAGKRQTQPGEINATNFKNEDAIVRAGMVRLGTMAPSLEKVPAPNRLPALSHSLGVMGIKGDAHDTLMEHFSKFDPNQLPKELQRISDAMLRATPEYAQAMDVENKKSETSKAVATIGANSRITVAEDKLAGKGAGKTDPNVDLMAWVRNESKGKPLDVQLSAYNRGIQIALSQNNQTLADALFKEATPIKQAIDANPNRNPRAGAPAMSELTNGRVPVNPAQQAPLVDPRAAGQPNPGAVPAVAPASKPQVPQAGQTINRNGQQWKYKGGDPKNPTSWERVS